MTSLMTDLEVKRFEKAFSMEKNVKLLASGKNECSIDPVLQMNCEKGETCVKLTNVAGGLKEDNPEKQELPFAKGMVFQKCWGKQGMGFLAKQTGRSPGNIGNEFT